MCRKIYAVVVGFIFFNALVTRAQNLLLYDSYSINPYLYNPAEAATEYMYVHLNHRQQWVGFEGAPKLSTLSVTSLLNDSRSGIGVKASSFTRGLLQTKDFLMTYAHAVPLNTFNTIYFGVSGGAVTNNINLSGIDASDPALLNYRANNVRPIGNFGILMRTSCGINLGVTLPQLFTEKLNNSNSFDQTNFSPLNNITFSGYYKKKIERKINLKKRSHIRSKANHEECYAPIELYFLYRYTKVGISQAEVTAKLNLSEHAWTSVVYRMASGYAACVGFKFGHLLINYAYEAGTQLQKGLNVPTHEMHLGMKLGDLKKLRRRTPALKSTLKGMPSAQHIARFEQQNPEAQASSAKRTSYYIVVKSFKDFTQADNYRLKLFRDKFNANIIFNKSDAAYHVFVYVSENLHDVHTEARNLKTFTKLKNVKVIKMNWER
jgi:type IX secretion system PorP/SprF family membrane protein